MEVVVGSFGNRQGASVSIGRRGAGLSGGRAYGRDHSRFPGEIWNLWEDCPHGS